jgi:hypothetical protein
MSLSSRLPEWYPLANATAAEIASWLAADAPDYAAMRQALPWLDREYQLDTWLGGVREVLASDKNTLSIRDLVGLASIPLPPRRAARKFA